MINIRFKANPPNYIGTEKDVDIKTSKRLNNKQDYQKIEWCYILCITNQSTTITNIHIVFSGEEVEFQLSKDYFDIILPTTTQEIEEVKINKAISDNEKDKYSKNGKLMTFPILLLEKVRLTVNYQINEKKYSNTFVYDTENTKEGIFKEKSTPPKQNQTQQNSTSQLKTTNMSNEENTPSEETPFWKKPIVQKIAGFIATVIVAIWGIVSNQDKEGATTFIVRGRLVDHNNKSLKNTKLFVNGDNFTHTDTENGAFIIHDVIIDQTGSIRFVLENGKDQYRYKNGYNINGNQITILQDLKFDMRK